MYLYFDNTDAGRIILYYRLDKRWIQKIFNGNRGGDLLLAVDRLLNELNKTVGDLKGVAVRVGPGRFTAARVAVTIGNTLAFSLKIPIISISEFDDESIVSSLEHRIIGRYVLAQYSAPAAARISQPKNYAV